MILASVDVDSARASHDTLDRRKLLPEHAVLLDLDRPPPTKHHLGGHVTVGAELELEFDLDGNFDLDSSALGDESSFKPNIEVAASYDPADWFQGFVELELARELLLRNPENKQPQTQLNIKELYMALRDYEHGVTFVVGRQHIGDDRQWILDADLDGARLVFRVRQFAIDGSATRQQLFVRDLLDVKNDEMINNYFFRALANFDGDLEAGLYIFYRDDLASNPEDLFFFLLIPESHPAMRRR